jgi:hypothetical protein
MSTVLGAFLALVSLVAGFWLGYQFGYTACAVDVAWKRWDRDHPEAKP